MGTEESVLGNYDSVLASIKKGAEEKVKQLTPKLRKWWLEEEEEAPRKWWLEDEPVAA
jgi:hypothetical protein